MNRRPPSAPAAAIAALVGSCRRSLPGLGAAVAVLVAAAGCGVLGTPPGRSAAPTHASGLGGPAQAVGDLPCPCTLLTDAEVRDLTGRDTTRIDEDGAQPGDPSRFCQWQQAGGQLAVFLTRTSAAGFASGNTEATAVDGVGEDAFALAGHLYVRDGAVSIDVYSRGDSDTENLSKAKRIAQALIPKL